MLKSSSFLISTVLLAMSTPMIALAPANNLQTVTFAGGCFWTMQQDFDNLKGVTATQVGYAGGKEVNPTYEQVSLGETNHLEAIQVTYDPSVISYSNLLNTFWHSIDPTDARGQFCDQGSQYTTAIFFQTPLQQQEAAKSKEQLETQYHFPTIATAIRPFTTFYPAEDYHQKYYVKNPVRFRFYEVSCGKQEKLKALWSSPRR